MRSDPIVPGTLPMLSILLPDARYFLPLLRGLFFSIANAS